MRIRLCLGLKIRAHLLRGCGLRTFSVLRPRVTTSVEVLDYRNIEVPEDIRVRGFQQKLLLTCEHASNHLPLPYRWSAKDQTLKDTHWAYDPGAAQVHLFASWYAYVKYAFVAFYLRCFVYAT